MTLDRRIVSILYFNGINDVESVDRFLGRNGDFFEVMIKGEIVKLKIPGNLYLDDDVYTQFEFENSSEEIVEDDVVEDDVVEDETIENTIIVENKNFEEELLDAKKSAENFSEFSIETYVQVTADEKTIEEETADEKTVEEETVEEETVEVDEEIKEFLGEDLVKKGRVVSIVEDSVDAVKKKTTRKKKKPDLDDDINDFINLA